MTSSFPDDSPRMAFDVEQIIHSLCLAFASVASVFYLKPNMILFDPEEGSASFSLHHPYFPNFTDPCTSRVQQLLWHHHTVHVCRIPPTSGLEGEHCGVLESSVVQLSSLQEFVANSVQVCRDNDPTPPHPKRQAASCLLATAWCVYHKEFCSRALKFGNHSETVFGI